MNSTEKLKALNAALTTNRAHYDRMIADADRILEARRVEHYQIVSRSEKLVGDLENQLKMYEALENDRYAAITRRQLAAAMEQHKVVVEQSNLALQQAIIVHSRGYAAVGIAFESGFNAATSRLD